MAVAIVVRARLFARLREQAGTETENVELPAGSTVADVYETIQKLHPGLQVEQSAVRVALNQEFTDWDSKVADGDEVALPSEKPLSRSNGTLPPHQYIRTVERNC